VIAITQRMLQGLARYAEDAANHASGSSRSRPPTAWRSRRRGSSLLPSASPWPRTC